MEALPDVWVIGGGLPGMVAAWLLARRGARVTLVEASSRLGGLYGSVDYGGGGVFDFGMRVLYDSGIAEIDTLLHSLLPEWQVLEGNRKDIAGIYWEGRLQAHSPYLDLRGRPEAGEWLAQLRVAAPAPAEDAEAYFRARFGAGAAEPLCRVVEKLYGLPACEVSAAAARHPAMDRVLLVDEDAMGPVLGDESLRARIGYPDQLRLPVRRASAQCGRYPRRMGMQQVVDALAERLRDAGVRVMMHTRVTALERHRERVTALALDGRRLAAGAVFWTAGLSPLAGLLWGAAPLRLPTVAQVHLRFAEKPRMEALYHCYVYDAGFRSFRVTQHGNYCEEAHNALGWPVCVEYWGEAEDAAREAAAELHRMGLVADAPTFRAVQPVPHIHQLFTLACSRSLATLREGIAGQRPANLFTAGMMAQGGELLLYEVLRAMHPQLDECLKNNA